MAKLTSALRPEEVSFSVVVSNYNYNQFLPECLDSVLLQLQGEDELIVVDDGSTDASLETLGRYQREHGLQLIARENCGHLNAVRTGISAARRKVILLLDADDYYLPGYLDRLRGLFAGSADLALVTTVPEIDSTVSAQARETAAMIGGMEFPDGLIGPTRWSTQLFFEFAGHPTSGLALRTDVARQIIAMPIFNLPQLNIGRIIALFIQTPSKTGHQLQISPDGLIVRCTSMMGVDRYHNSSPGFHYRFHPDNMYATMKKLSRWYARVHRKKIIIALCREALDLSHFPTVSELKYEICHRAWAQRTRRRFRFRTLYFLRALRSKGSFRERVSAASAAILTPTRWNG